MYFICLNYLLKNIAGKYVRTDMCGDCVLLSDFSEKKNMWIRFNETPHCQISLKVFQKFVSYHIQTQWEFGTFFKLSTSPQYSLLPKLSAVPLTLDDSCSSNARLEYYANN
jgi:hypothetical protein